MNKNSIASLIEEFELASNSTRELLDSMEMLKTVLNRYYDSLSQIDDIRDEIKNSGLTDSVGNVEKIADGINEIFKNVIDSVDSVDKSVKEIHEYNNKNVKSFSDLNMGFKKLLSIFGNIEETALKVSSINNESLENIAVKLDEKSRYINDGIKKIEDMTREYDTEILKKFNKMEAKSHENIEVIDDKLDKINKSLIDANNTFDAKNEETISNIIELTDTNQKIHDILETMSNSNEDAMDTFFMLIDEWAKDNVHGVALKRKSKDKKR